MDIVDQVLEKISVLKPFFEKDIKYYFDDEGNPETDINLGTKLGSLDMAFRYYVEEINFDQKNLKLLLDMLEAFAQKASEEELGQLEVMFLEDLVWWAEDKEDDYAQRYGDYFLSCLGPKCRELVKRNKEFWKEVNRAKQERIDQRYADLQRKYDKEKAEQEK